MAEKQYVDKAGLTELVSQTKSYVDSKISAIPKPWTVSSDAVVTSYPIIRTGGAYLSTGELLAGDEGNLGYQNIPGAIFGSGSEGVEYGYLNDAPISPALLLAADSSESSSSGSFSFSGLTFTQWPATVLAEAANGEGSSAPTQARRGAMDVIFDAQGKGRSSLPGLHFRSWTQSGRVQGEAVLDPTTFGTVTTPSVILTSDNWEQHIALSDVQNSIQDIKNALCVTDIDFPYLELESADLTKAVQIMTNGNYGGDRSGGGMGIRFRSNDGNGTAPQSYGNLALKAEPAHGWDYVLTLPNETGTLATRNYADDVVATLESKVTTQQVGYIRWILTAAQDDLNLYSIPKEATGVEADIWFYKGTSTVSNNLYIGFGTTDSTHPHATWSTISYENINESTGDLNTAPHLKIFMSREPGSATAKYLVIDMNRASLIPDSGTSSYLIDKIVCDKPQYARILGIVRIYLKGDMAPQIVS